MLISSVLEKVRISSAMEKSLCKIQCKPGAVDVKFLFLNLPSKAKHSCVNQLISEEKRDRIHCDLRFIIQGASFSCLRNADFRLKD